MIRLSLMIFVLVLCFESRSERVSRNKDIAPFTLKVRTEHGSRIGEFKLERKNGEAVLSLNTNDGIQVLSKKLSNDDTAFIIEALMQLKPAATLPPECRRANVTIESEGLLKPSVMKSCFGVRTISTQGFERFVRILTLAAGHDL